ncbi:MAG: hypothetical protein AAF824_01295 [Bacteroidota bacterium]
MKNQRLLTFYVPRSEFDNGPLDFSQKLFDEVGEEMVEEIKYMMQSPAADGLYVSVVYLAKRDKEKGILGFKGQ